MVGSVSAGSLPTRPSSWAVSRSICGDVRLLAGEQVLGLGEVGQAERPELLPRPRPRQSSSSASMSDRPRRRRSISTSRIWACMRYAPPQPQGDARRGRGRSTAMIAPTAWTAMPRSAMPRRSSDDRAAGDQEPDRRRARATSRDSGRQVGSGATSNVTSTSPDRAALSSRIRPSSVRSRSTPARRTGSGLRRRMAARQDGELGGDVDRLAVALVALLRRRRVRRSSRSAWRAFSSRLRRSARAVSASARRSRAPDSVSRSRSSWASASSPWSSAAWRCSTACSATLSRPGFLSPCVLRSWSALSSFLRARLVPRSAPLIDAWSRSRRAPSSRDRSLSSRWRTDAVERKKASVGMPVSSAMTWSASVGSVIDWPS